MKKILLFLTLFFIVDLTYAQQKVQELRLLVTIDDEIDQDLINGQFIVKDKDHKLVDQMSFRAWVGKLEIAKEDYKKIFKVPPTDSLYVTFEYNSYELDTIYTYEGKIPRSLINDEYFIFKIYNKKNKDSRDKYEFPVNKDYILQVVSPGFATRLRRKKSN